MYHILVARACRDPSFPRVLDTRPSWSMPRRGTNGCLVCLEPGSRPGADSCQQLLARFQRLGLRTNNKGEVLISTGRKAKWHAVSTALLFCPSCGIDGPGELSAFPEVARQAIQMSIEAGMRSEHTESPLSNATVRNMHVPLESPAPPLDLMETDVQATLERQSVAPSLC